jgi:hypothetical protein
VRLVEIAASIFILRGLVGFGCDLWQWQRRRDDEVEREHLGERVTEKTRQKLAEPAVARPDVVRDPRFLRGGSPDRRRA